MLLINLPSIILENVLNYSVILDEHSIRDWKKTLKLLAISRKLRIIGIPVVYKTAYMRDGVEDGKGFNSSHNSGYIANMAGITNIGLIKSMKFTNSVKSIVINLNCSHYIDSLVEEYSSIFEFNTNNWSFVKSIIFISEDTQPEAPSLTFQSNLEKMAYALKQYMPKVNNVGAFVFNTSTDTFSRNIIISNTILGVFASQLVYTTYIDSLVNVEMSSMLYNKMICQEDNLNRGRQKNYYYIDNLKRLYATHTMSQLIESIPQSLENNNSYYVFNKLEYLMLVICNKSAALGYNKNTSGYKKHLVFPALKKVKLSLFSIIQLAEILKLNYFDCQNVEELYITTRVRGTPIFDDTYSDAAIGYMSNAIVKMLSQSMPQLKIVRLNCSTMHKQNVPLITNIMKHYYKEIESIFIDQLVTCPAQSFTALANLTISCTHTTQYEFVNASSATLLQLCMRDVPHTFTWKDLCRSQCTRTALFKSLVQFNIMFAIESILPPADDFIEWSLNNSSHQAFNVCCPNLKQIIVRKASYNSIYSVFRYLERLDNVTKLYIDYSEEMNSRMDKELINSTEFAIALTHLGKKIFCSLPLVNYLAYNNKMHDKLNDPWFCILNKGYSKQLRHVESDACVPLNDLCYSSSLKNAKLSVDNKVIDSHPSILPDNLTDINITDNSGTFSWSWFTRNNNANHIEFNNLLRCHIQVFKNTDSSRDVKPNSQDYHITNVEKIFIPNIEKFEFEVFNLNAKISGTELYLGTAGSIILIGPLNVLPTRGNIKSDILGNIEMTVKSADADDEKQFYNVVNSWFGYRKPLGECDLVLEDIQFDLDPRMMCWHNVAKLELGYAIKCSVLLQILPSMSDLKRLEIDQLVEDCSDSYSYYTSPISTSITEIAIESIEAINASSMFGITQLLIGITSLKSFSIEEVGLDSAAFVKQYREYYPHVADITFS